MPFVSPRLSRALLSSVVLSSALSFALPAAAQDAAVAADEEVLELEPIVVTASRVPVAAREVGSAVTVIDRAELESRQIRVVSDALRSVPGVAVSRTGPAGGPTKLRLRGSEANQTLVLIDGIEVNDPASDSEFDFSRLLAADIERIEVLRGPQSALYGSDAIGGVVNIITAKGEGPLRVTAAAEGGSRGTAAGSLSAGAGGENYDWFASLAGLTTDGFSSAAEWRGNSEADGYRNGTAFAKLGWNPLENLRLDLVGRLTDFDAESDGFVGGAGAVDADEASEGRQLFGRAQATLDLADGRWRQVFGVSRSRHDYDYLSGDDGSSYVGDKTKVDWQNTLTAETAAILPATHRLTLALEHEEDAARIASSWSSFDRSIGQTALVGEYGLGLVDDLFLTASLRHDVNDLFGDVTTWRATAAYTVEATGTKLRASYGTGVKNPTLFELYGYTDTYRGNPDLRPEHAEGFDIGFDQPLFDDRLVVEATVFDQRITDLIQGAGSTSVNLSGTSPIQGIELGLTLTPLDDLTIRAAYTFLDGEDAAGAELIRRPAHTASLDVGYRFLDGRGNLNLGIVYNGAAKDWAYDAVYNRTVVELDPYWLVNLAGSWKLNDNAEIYARIDNLFDERYEEVFTYGGSGRTAIAGLKVSF